MARQMSGPKPTPKEEFQKARNIQTEANEKVREATAYGQMAGKDALKREKELADSVAFTKSQEYRKSRQPKE